jgi:putative oxidoreductase
MSCYTRGRTPADFPAGWGRAGPFLDAPRGRAYFPFMQKDTMGDIGRLILRLTTAGLILFHGVSKIIHGVSWMAGPLAAVHLPAFFAYGVYVGEVAAPLLMAVGLWTRLAAILVAANMVIAVLLEAWRLFPTIKPTGGWGLELEAFYLLCAAAVFLLGAGRFSVARSPRRSS